MPTPHPKKNSHTDLVTLPHILVSAMLQIPHEQHSAVKHPLLDDNHDDSALENAIGDAFKQFAMLEDKESPKHESEGAEIGNLDASTDLGDDTAAHNESMDLENVVGDVIGQMIQSSEQMERLEAPETAETAANAAKDHSLEIPRDASDFGGNQESGGDDDADLEAAIGDAFKSLAGGAGETDKKDDTKLENAIDAAFESLTASGDSPEHQKSPEHHQGGENEAEEASSKPEESLMDAALQAAISASLQELRLSSAAARESNDTNVDLVDIVHDVVHQITTTHALELQSVSRETLRDSISEIVTKNERLRASLVAEPAPQRQIPSLDDTVLAHFQSEANRDDAADLDSAIRSAVTTAMGSVLPKESSESQSGPESLEKLQMNEILQNAFNMAMQNPQELLTTLEYELEEPKIAQESAQPSQIPAAAALAALTAKTAISKETATIPETKTVGQEVAEALAPKKPLSIAETLALHRQSMNLGKRDYSLIHTLEDLAAPTTKASAQRAKQTHPQLSSILSSLSQHIQSGTQSQNLMLVIRHMTNTLMLNRTNVSVSVAVQDLVQTIKNEDAEEAFFLDALRRTRTFIAGNLGDKEKEMEIMASAARLFADDISKPRPSSEKWAGLAEKDLTTYYNAAQNALSSYNSARLRNAVSGIKADVESVEYKDRVRIENRERKKKWREENAERNKDNDLRSRVLKRANHMFGEELSAAKLAWMEDEFNKRKNKRLAKQKSDEVKQEPLLALEPPFADVKPSNGESSHDAKLAKRCTDMFNIVAECGADEDAPTVLTATLAATAVVAAMHEKDSGRDFKVVEAAISGILTAALHASVRSGSYRRIAFLSKFYAPESEAKLNRKPAVSGEAEPAPKRPKSEHPPTKAEELEALRAPQWSSGLKMPLYRKPSPVIDPAFGGISENEPKSPFISNKLGEARTAPTGGLRKPGTFQKPQMNARLSGHRFPTLYSTAFKLQ